MSECANESEKKERKKKFPSGQTRWPTNKKKKKKKKQTPRHTITIAAGTTHLITDSQTTGKR
jgi:hypothetical protein